MKTKIILFPSQGPLEIYVDANQLELALFNLLSWLNMAIHQAHNEAIKLTCHAREESAVITVESPIHFVAEDFTHQTLAKQGLMELQEKHLPWLYVFEKVLKRCGGLIQIDQGHMTLSFPKYRWQDVQTVDELFSISHIAWVVDIA